MPLEGSFAYLPLCAKAAPQLPVRHAAIARHFGQALDLVSCSTLGALRTEHGATLVRTSHFVKRDVGWQERSKHTQGWEDHAVRLRRTAPASMLCSAARHMVQMHPCR